MSRVFVTIILAFAPHPLLAGSFELSLDETSVERVLVVARAGGGVFSVAAGGDDLRVLRGEEAARARARLARFDGENREEPAGEEDDDKKRKKIVIHKMDVHDVGAGAGDEDMRAVRIFKGEVSKRREETLLEEDGETLIKDDVDGDKSLERNVIRLMGADEARAIKFIDETKGLDDGEKAEMKAAVGL